MSKLPLRTTKDISPSDIRARRAVNILTAYLVFAVTLYPMLTVLRATQVFDTATLSQYVNTATIVLLIVLGPPTLRRASSGLHNVLILVAIQAALLGAIFNLDYAHLRPYMSHLFQLCAAYVMLNLGIVVGPRITERHWRRLALLSLLGGITGSLLTAAQWGAGNVAYYTAPVYRMILGTAYALGFKLLLVTVASLGAILVSGKRGVMVAALVAIVAAIMLRRVWLTRSKDLASSGVLVFGLAVTILGIVSLSSTTSGETSSTLTNIARQSYERSERAIDAIRFGGEDQIDAAASGRVEEMRAAAAQTNVLTVLVGGGAGATFEVGTRGELHFLHFTPLSLIFVYGLPFAICVYGFALMQVARRWRSAVNGHRLDAFACLYLFAALVYTLFAYSLFIDLLIFYFVGYLYQRNRTALS